MSLLEHFDELRSRTFAGLVYPQGGGNDVAGPMLRLVFTAGAVDQALRASRRSAPGNWRIVR